MAPAGDPPIRDRDGNWTYPFSVVVDDLRQDIDHVIRGRDLITRRRPRSGSGVCWVGSGSRRSCTTPDPTAGWPKLSKSSGDTGVRELRDAGTSPAEVRALAADRGQIPPFGEPDEQNGGTTTHHR